MNRWEKALLILGIVVMGLTPVVVHFLALPRQTETAVAAPVAKAARKPAKTNGAEERYQACLKKADTSRDVAWEISCESLNEGAAQKYNACVAHLASKGKIADPPKACETNCILPHDIAKPLIDHRDAAKSKCLNDMKAAIKK